MTLYFVREEIKRVPDNESITDYYWSLISFIHGPVVSLNYTWGQIKKKNITGGH